LFRAILNTISRARLYGDSERNIAKNINTGQGVSPLNTPSQSYPSPKEIDFIIGSANSDNDSAVPLTEQSPVTTYANHHVLVVDDNLINLKILVKLLEQLGCSYATATNGLDAVQLYKVASKTQPFSFIFMDISMPVMNGFVASHEIRAFEQEQRSSPTYIVALTGLGSAASKEEAFTSGVNLFLTKPVGLQTIKALLIGEKKD
jgi:CheY-like chemotaxis protein